MNRVMIAVCMLAVVTLAGCAGGGDWTPMSGGRTAGKGDVVATSGSHKADKSFNHAMHK